MSHSTPNLGVELAERLGLKILRREGHDLAGPCIACSSSDAFKLHQQTGVAHCFSCGGSWSPYQVTEVVLGDKGQARDLMIELGVFQPSSNGQSGVSNPIITIARQKKVSAQSLIAYGAKEISPKEIRLPAYGPDGDLCTTFTMSTDGSKGLFEKGKPAGLFFPHENGAVRIPKLGETWHIVEGPKDAAALHEMGLLACGLNTCRLAVKFARLFKGVNVILIPDRDRAGDDGSQHSAGVLRGIAASTRIAVLPAKFKGSHGEDVRDILRRPNGRQQLEQAIADAQPAHSDTENPAGQTGPDAPVLATTQIELPEGDPLTLTVHPPDGRPQRLVIVTRGNVEHRDRVDINSSVSRGRLTKQLAAKLKVDHDQLAELVEPQIIKLADQCDDFAASVAGEDDFAQSQATMVAKMAAEWELWHTPGNDAFVTIPVGEHFETWSVKSQRFKRFVAKQFFDRQGTAMNSDALSASVNLIEAMALFDGDEYDVHVRVAEHNGNIYLDLCNDTWQVVEITDQGWQIKDDCPVKFRRSKGMLPLPTPVAGWGIDELRKFLNVDDATWPLVIAWLIATLRPRGPYPLLAFFADQGSGKSTVGRFLRCLIDPNSAPLRAEPKDGRDLMITANNSWCLAYDNLSHVPPWMSDALCRLSTGGGFATRELYTDQDEIIFDSQRPVMLTSIEEVATRSDLLDRCLIVWLPTIPDERRRPEAEMELEFEAVRPRVLGALLDAVSVAIRELPNVRLPCLPRMADFALWVTAAETGLGWAPGTFHKAYLSNRDSANDLALESSVIGRPLLEHLEKSDGWSGSSSELLEILGYMVSEHIRKQQGWPKDPRALSGQLTRIKHNLRNAGWSVEFKRVARRRLWTIRRMTQDTESMISAVSSSGDQPAAPTEELPMQSDADRDNWPYGDAYDGDDAIPPTDGQPPTQHSDGDDTPF